MRQISSEVRKSIIKEQLGLPISMAISAWGMFLLDALFGIDLVGGETDSTAAALYFAIGATVIFAAYAGYQVYKALQLAKSGVEVIAEISSVGSISAYDLVHVNCEYFFDNQSFHVKWSVHTLGVQKLLRSGQVVLIIDPLKPSRWMRRDQVFGEIDS